MISVTNLWASHCSTASTLDGCTSIPLSEIEGREKQEKGVWIVLKKIKTISNATYKKVITNNTKFYPGSLEN